MLKSFAIGTLAALAIAAASTTAAAQGKDIVDTAVDRKSTRLNSSHQ